jgi:hypothetical protein
MRSLRSSSMRSLRLLLPILPMAGALACAPPPEPANPPPATSLPANAAPASFDLDKEQLRTTAGGERLIQKLESNRFHYFRMLALPFERRTCEAFRGQSASLPVTAIHGDAHVEQFVVTAKTYGLEDFDRAGFGPVVVDLVRYAASLHVACSDASWPCDGDAAVDRFMRAYGESLDKQQPEAPEPAVVERLREKTPKTAGAWLTWSEKLTVPLPSDVEAKARNAWTGFAKVMLEIHPEWPKSMLDVVSIGSLSMGLGSALEKKALFRVAGPTAAPQDDLLIEAREGTEVETGSCVLRASYGGSLILMFMSILGRRMPEVHGFVPLPGSSRRAWVQSWELGYEELAARDIESQAELEQVAVDAARQLGGHFWTRFPEPLRPVQRHAQLEAFGESRARVVELAKIWALESNLAWQRFRDAKE